MLRNFINSIQRPRHRWHDTLLILAWCPVWYFITCEVTNHDTFSQGLLRGFTEFVLYITFPSIYLFASRFDQIKFLYLTLSKKTVPWSLNEKHKILPPGLIRSNSSILMSWPCQHDHSRSVDENSRHWNRQWKSQMIKYVEGPFSHVGFPITTIE